MGFCIGIVEGDKWVTNEMKKLEVRSRKTEAGG